jgi:arylsulfatase A-like enzyme
VSKRFFAWIHLYDPHAPYDPPEPFKTRYAGRPYDGEIAWTDELVGRLTDALDGMGLTERTIVAVLADHGESLGEHGESGHGYRLRAVSTSCSSSRAVLRDMGRRPGGGEVGTSP